MKIPIIFSGGYVIPVEEMKKIQLLAERYGAHIHMDGARLFHAAAALNVPVKEITQYTDTVMFCISKGLGAPVVHYYAALKNKSLKPEIYEKFLVVVCVRQELLQHAEFMLLNIMY